MPDAKNLTKCPEQPNAMFLSVRPNIPTIMIGIRRLSYIFVFAIHLVTCQMFYVTMITSEPNIPEYSHVWQCPSSLRRPSIFNYSNSTPYNNDSMRRSWNFEMLWIKAKSAVCFVNFVVLQRALLSLIFLLLCNGSNMNFNFLSTNIL